MKIDLKKQRNFRILYKEGFSLKAIAKKENTSPNTVKKYLLKQGVKVKGQNIIKELRINDQRLIGIYCGLWAGDGTQYYDKGYTVKFCCHSDTKELIAFIQELLLTLFGKTSNVYYEIRHRATVRFKSQFIFNFSQEYLSFERNKGLTVHLKKPIEKYEKKFIEGFILGLMLSDGYLKRNMCYSTISKKLANDVQEILSFYGFQSRIYRHDRKKYGWNDLFMVSMRKKESEEFRILLDQILKKMNYKLSFSILKGYGGPAEI